MFSSFALPFELFDLHLDVRNFSFELLVLEQLISKTDTKLAVETQVNLWISFVFAAGWWLLFGSEIGCVWALLLSRYGAGTSLLTNERTSVNHISLNIDSHEAFSHLNLWMGFLCRRFIGWRWADIEPTNLLWLLLQLLDRLLLVHGRAGHRGGCNCGWHHSAAGRHLVVVVLFGCWLSSLCSRLWRFCCNHVRIVYIEIGFLLLKHLLGFDVDCLSHSEI